MNIKIYETVQQNMKTWVTLVKESKGNDGLLKINQTHNPKKKC